MKVLLALVSLLFLGAQIVNAKNVFNNNSTQKIALNESDNLADCDPYGRNCLTENDPKSKNLTKDQKKKNINKNKKIIKNNKTADYKSKTKSDADMQDTSKPNSFISETESGSAPTKAPVTPPNSNRPSSTTTNSTKPSSITNER